MQHRGLLHLLPALGLILIACDSDNVGPAEELTLESAHFIFHGTAECATMADLEVGAQRAETLFGRIADMVGSANTPLEKIHVHLLGDIADRRPFVDSEGINLYRFAPEDGGYWALLAHEMTHAFGSPWFVRVQAGHWPTYRFFFEGFAEFVAQTVDPQKRGFSFWGFQEDAVAGHWLTSGELIPMDILRTRHGELNRPCEVQAYPQRASWFRHVDEVYGRQAVLDLAFPHTEPTTGVVRSLIGVGLEELDQEWEAWLAARYTALPRADEIARAYRHRTSSARVCRAGVDF